MNEIASIVLSGNLSPKWVSLERHLCATGNCAVTRFSGSPEETLAHCHRVVPCVLVVDEAFTDRICIDDFSDAVDCGRAIRVLVEADSQDFGKTERLIRIGCRGVLSRNARPATARRALQAIRDGEIWAGRKTIANIVQNLLHDVKCRLTFRETEIMALLGEGLKNHEIAERLFISPQTVRWHLRVLYSKLGTHDRFSAVRRIPSHFERDSSSSGGRSEFTATSAASR